MTHWSAGRKRPHRRSAFRGPYLLAVTELDEAYVQVFAAALHREVREMVAYRIHPPPPMQATSAHPVAVSDTQAQHVISIGRPLEQERLPESQLPAVSVTVDGGVVRVEARGRVLEYGLAETVYHYQPDGRSPEEHAGWLAELWMEEAG